MAITCAPGANTLCATSRIFRDIQLWAEERGIDRTLTIRGDTKSLILEYPDGHSVVERISQYLYARQTTFSVTYKCRDAASAPLWGFTLHSGAPEPQIIVMQPEPSRPHTKTEPC